MKLSTWAELVYNFESDDWCWRKAGGEKKHGPFVDKEVAKSDAFKTIKERFPEVVEDEMMVVFRGLPPRCPGNAQPNNGRLVRRKDHD